MCGPHRKTRSAPLAATGIGEAGMEASAPSPSSRMSPSAARRRPPLAGSLRASTGELARTDTGLAL